MTTSTKIILGASTVILAVTGIVLSVYQTSHYPSGGTETTKLPHSSPTAHSATVRPVDLSAPAYSAADAKAPKPASAPALGDTLALTDAFKRKLALAALGHDTTASDSKRALELLAQLKDPADRASFIEGMMAAATMMPAADAVSLAAELPSGADQDGGAARSRRQLGSELQRPRESNRAAHGA